MSPRRSSIGPDQGEEQIADVLRRKGYVPEGITHRTPRDEVADSDPSDTLHQELQEETERLGKLTVVSGRLLAFFFADGAHPAAVMRRVFAYAKKVRPDLIGHLSLRDLGMLSGESHEAWRWRITQWFDLLQERRGGEAVRAPWQRGDATRAACSRAQKGNRNRSGGKRRK